MGDQGAGGGIESSMAAHRRQDSTDEQMSIAIPAEPATETRSQAQKPDQQEDFVLQNNARLELPRATRVIQNKSSDVLTSPSQTPTGLSRNPSTSSNISSSRPSNEYTSGCGGNGNGRQTSPVSGHATERFMLRPIEPPVTKATLSELDVSKIIHNPKLRHDINFDPELHFRPNLDGEKGRKKQEKANQFWNMLEEQLLQFVTDREGFYRQYGESGDWCLPSLLTAAKEIIATLIPQRDRELLDDGLNVELLMQQFNRGVADLERLAVWLSGVLKLHCAPMRDEWVDEMYNELSNGNRDNDVGELVKGMRSLLNVLEAMKLDVANHQIRCLRPVLIEDTVSFEQRFFLKKMQARKVSVSAARLWYREAEGYAARQHGGSPMPYAQSFGDMGVFFEALSRLILPSTSPDTIPNTFIFDEDRLTKLRSDMYDSICLEVCMRKYEDLERLSGVTKMYYDAPAYAARSTCPSNRSSANFNFNTPPSSRPSSLSLSDRGSSNWSPRNSGGLFAQPPIADKAESRSRAQNLYNSLLALLHTAPATRSDQRWQGLAGPISLQILRYVNAPHSLLGFESRLAAWLGDVHGETFQEVELEFQHRLLAELAKRVKSLKQLSGIALFSVATGGRVAGPANRGWDAARDSNPTGELRDPRDEAGIEDMATRLAHLGILHWRVWEQLAYAGGSEGEPHAGGAASS